MRPFYDVNFAQKINDLGFDYLPVQENDLILMYNPDIELNSDLMTAKLLSGNTAYILPKESATAKDEYEVVIMDPNGNVVVPSDPNDKKYVGLDVSADKLFDLNCFCNQKNYESLRGKLLTYSKINSSKDYSEFMEGFNSVNSDEELRILANENEELFPIALMTENSDYGTKELMEELDSELGRSTDIGELPIDETVPKLQYDELKKDYDELKSVTKDLEDKLVQFNEKLLMLIGMMSNTPNSPVTEVASEIEPNGDYSSILNAMASVPFEGELE